MTETKNNELNTKQLFTTKSIICSSQIQNQQTNIRWYREPPYPYQLEQLVQYNDQKYFFCSTLDLYCNIKCRSFKNDSLIKQQTFGPIEPFLYSKISSEISLKVNVNLFNCYKKCNFCVFPVPTLINPLNGTKYQLTTQDIKSIYLKFNRQFKSSKGQLKDSYSSSIKNVIVVNNLFQRLILLKLFHQIPNGMYCYNMQVVQIIFFDENACNLALQAINQIKYSKKSQKKSQLKIKEQNIKGFIKHSFENSFSNGLDLSKSILTNKNQVKQLKNMTISDNKQLKQFCNYSKLIDEQHLRKKNDERTGEYQVIGMSSKSSVTIKTPKQSLISNNQSSKSSLTRQNKNSLYNKNSNRDQNKSSKDLNLSPSSKNICSTESNKTPKTPKMSVLSTDMASIRQKRQQKQSFPDVPSTNNLKSSQLLKPVQKKGQLLTLRRSQEQLKTPRTELNNENERQKQREKQRQKQKGQVEYVDQFESLLFEKQIKDQNQICLNDSFQRMEQKDNKSSSKKMDRYLQQKEWKQTKNLIQIILKQNQILKQKNIKIVQEICQIKIKKAKNLQLQQYQQQVQNLKKQQRNLQNQLQILRTINSQIIHQKHQKTIIFRNSNQAKTNLQFYQSSNMNLNRNSQGFPINKSRINKSRENKCQNLYIEKTFSTNPKIFDREAQGLSYKYPSKQQSNLNNLSKY